jgi:hypothetical protein
LGILDHAPKLKLRSVDGLHSLVLGEVEASVDVEHARFHADVDSRFGVLIQINGDEIRFARIGQKIGSARGDVALGGEGFY